MSNYRININRLNISMHGVSAAVVDEASENLEAELKRRLGTLRISQRGIADLGFINLGLIDIAPSTDGATLRSLIAERLSAALQQELQTSEEGAP